MKKNKISRYRTGFIPKIITFDDSHLQFSFSKDYINA